MTQHIPDELAAQINRDRAVIEQELPDLARRDARMKEAASETTVSAHLRQAIHQSHRPLASIAQDAGVPIEALRGFLEGVQTLRSDVLDRLAQAVRVTVSLSAAS